MPTILKFDDPALVATLAAQAGGYAVNRDQQQLALQQQQQADNFALQRARLDQQTAAFRPAPTSGVAPAVDPGGTEVLPNGAQIFHPPGSPVPQQAGQPAGGGRGMGKLGQLMPGGGYLSPLQRQQSAAIDQMEEAGQLDPGEAVRWRMQVAAGGNPFEQPSIGEQMRVKQRTDRADTLTQYQRAALDDKSADNARLDADRQSKEADRAYSRAHDALKAELDVLLKRRGDVLPGQSTAPIDGQIDQVMQRMKELASPKAAAAAGPATRPSAAVAGGSTAVAAAPATRPAGGNISITPGRPGGPAGGFTQVTAGRPTLGAATPPAAAASQPAGPAGVPSRADVAYLVQKYGSAAAAREAFAAGERAPAGGR